MIENEMTVSVPLEVVKASEIEPKEVKWLWYPYIPVGKVTLLQGDPGDGKSKLMLSIAALLSKGEPLPFTETEENEPMTIIYQTTEDDADDTVVPMTEQGFKGFQRGEYGSTAEHLTSLQYQIKQDKERLEKLQKRIQREQIKYEPARNVSKTYNEIDRMGQKTITGKMAISKEDYSELTALAKEGITSRAEISELEQSANYYRQKYFDCANALERMKTKYNELKEKCRPFLQALEHFPEVAKLFTEKVKQLFSFKEAQERAEKERQERIKARRNKRGMER